MSYDSVSESAFCFYVYLFFHSLDKRNDDDNNSDDERAKELLTHICHCL